MFFTLLITAILTAIALVAAGVCIAKLIAPRSYNAQKAEAYGAVYLHVDAHRCNLKLVITCSRFCF